MKAREVIKALQERLALYGDWDVQIRTKDEDRAVESVYVDHDALCIMISSNLGEE